METIDKLLSTAQKAAIVITVFAGFLMLADTALERQQSEVTDMHGNKISDVEAFYGKQLSSHEQIVYLYGADGEAF